MTRIGATSPELLAEMLDWYRSQKSGRAADSAQPSPELGISFENSTGFEIPAFGVFQGHTVVNVSKRTARVVAKRPIDGTAAATAIFVNGARKVPDKETGTAQIGPLYSVAHDGTAVDGQYLGLKANSFLSKLDSNGPFLAIGTDDTRDNIKLCLFQAGRGALVRIFRTPSGGIAANSSATCDELNEARTTVIGSATVWNQRSSVVPGGVDILAMSSGTRLWMVEPNCPTLITEP